MIPFAVWNRTIVTMVFRFSNWTWTFPGARVVGILNVTPDSFYDGSRFQGIDAALARAEAMAAEGADAIDVGGESTRPGAAPVPVDDELRRVVPVIEALAGRLSIPISIDTRKAAVARSAVGAGAAIVNDVSGGREDPALLEAAARSGAGLILMHSRGTPQTMQSLTRYGSVLEEVAAELRISLDEALRAGVPEDHLVVDPGIGFAKDAAQNLELLSGLSRLRDFGRPVLLGVSRKSFLGAIVGGEPRDRLAASLSAQFLGLLRGADLIRTHDVAETVQTVKMLKAILAAGPDAVP